ncbi:MAG TPA: DUF3800 domain-containing protein [Candidatus Acidoferrum sp.]|nr:DUF3800 domain-containing protein [Candidatus Acidoferrum sp.]
MCYLDESGTPELTGNTSHFILAGLAIPIWHWRDCERELAQVRQRYGLNFGDVHAEIHTAWLLRVYLEQTKITGFSALSHGDRRLQVEAYRRGELLRIQRIPNQKERYKQTKKNYRFTAPYIHLTFEERKALIRETAVCISKWGFARLFAECIDKINYPALNAKKAKSEQREVNEQALEQIVSRFENYLRIISSAQQNRTYGLLIHDNNETVCKKHTALMKRFHQSGTLWTNVSHIVETPLFVNSELTSMVQIADLCAYSIRRYLENGEHELFDLIFQRADRKDNVGKTSSRIVGVRHYSIQTCACKICESRKFN